MKRHTNLRVQATWQGWQVALLIIVILLIYALVKLNGADFQPVPPASTGAIILPSGAVSELQPNWQGPLQPSTAYVPPTNELHTVDFTGTNDSGYFVFEIEFTGNLETSTNLVDWDVVSDNPAYCKNIVGYMVPGTEPKRYFRSKPLP